MPRLRLTTALTAIALAVLSTTAQAADLKVGDPAPPVALGKFVKGEPVTSIDKGTVYVFEFWATWCGPCIQAIPHVTQLQKKHPDVVFIGANVWENDEAKVEPFVKRMGDKMDYRVAMDDKSNNADGAMATTWLRAAGQNGIPCSFIIDKEGKIAWIGHPMQMDKVLEQVAAGKYDDAARKKLADDEAALAAKMQKIQRAVEAKVVPHLQKQDFAAAAGEIDNLIVDFPDEAKQLRQFKYGLQLQAQQYDAAYATADQIAADANDDAEALNALAWMIVDEPSIQKRDYDRAEKYATRAIELAPDNAAILDTLARVQFEKGDIAKAVATQTKAVELADDNLREELQTSLEKYKAASTK